jgi:hypothetical protein
MVLISCLIQKAMRQKKMWPLKRLRLKHRSAGALKHKYLQIFFKIYILKVIENRIFCALLRLFILGSFFTIRIIFLKNGLNESSEILYTSYWFRPTSNGTLINITIYQVPCVKKKQRQRSPFKAWLNLLLIFVTENR